MESRYNEVPRTGKMCSLNRGLSIQFTITGLKNVARYSGGGGGGANWPSQNLPRSQNTDVNK